MLACQYTLLNRCCLPELPGAALGLTCAPWSGGLTISTISLSSACRSTIPLTCCSGTPFARCSRTPSPSFGCSSACVLHGGASVLGEGATGAPSSSDHSDIATLHVRVVWSPLSEMPIGFRGAALAVFLFFWASSSTAALFP